MSIKLKKFDPQSKQGKLFQALVIDGEKLSESQIEKRFGIKNPSATVSAIRQNGYVIWSRQRKAANGVEVTEYEHGEPSRRMIVAAYKARAMGLI
jgi:hypothetical protein